MGLERERVAQVEPAGAPVDVPPVLAPAGGQARVAADELAPAPAHGARVADVVGRSWQEAEDVRHQLERQSVEARHVGLEGDVVR